MILGGIIILIWPVFYFARPVYGEGGPRPEGVVGGGQPVRATTAS